MNTFTQKEMAFSHDNLPEGFKDMHNEVGTVVCERIEQDLAGWINTGGPLREVITKTTSERPKGLIPGG